MWQEAGMFPEERRQWLVSRARADGRLDVAAVSEELDVAPETIRRDLNVLESHGLLHRVHGGAIPVERLGFEGALATRAITMHDEKVRLAKVAVELLEDAESIYLDEGSTAQALVDALPLDRPLTVVTNALPTDLVIDLAYVGTNGISVDRGLTTPDPAVAAVKSAAVAAARRRVLIADHTKFGVNSFCRFAHVRDLEAIVTDSGLGGEDAAPYVDLGVKVIRA
jgi:DeoR family fructose operon transcriptional repressor